ncbi:MAG: hypothetical protein RL757_389, partial [Bacteroidota bacterium]
KNSITLPEPDYEEVMRLKEYRTIVDIRQEFMDASYVLLDNGDFIKVSWLIPVLLKKTPYSHQILEIFSEKTDNIIIPHLDISLYQFKFNQMLNTDKVEVIRD